MRHSTLNTALCVTMSALAVVASTLKRADGFVSVQGTNFTLDGKNFAFFSTSAYWLSTLSNDTDITTTLQSMKAGGIKVVRTWGFNDVSEIPSDDSVWFQLIKDGKTTINEGANGLQKLDKIISDAELNGLYVQIVLTNNWNPIAGEDPNQGQAGLRKRQEDSRLRNALSNDYGGMDAYVREFGVDGKHSEFYTNRTIVDNFKAYVAKIVDRYKDSKSVFAWEIANDARCDSSLPAAKDCNTLVVTDWHDEIARHIKSIDKNHLVTSGAHGFNCVKCPKRFTIPNKKRDITRIIGRHLTEMEVRQFDPTLGSSTDGTFGIDSEDLAGSPNIDFASFQLLPDMNNYVLTDRSRSSAEQALAIGQSWTIMQSQSGATVGKPVVMSSAGLVTIENQRFFVPVNGTEPSSRTDLQKRQDPSNPSRDITNAESVNTFSSWSGAASSYGISGVGHYQWSQPELTPGNTVSASAVDGGTSPNDGFASVPPPPGEGTRFA